MNNIWGLNHTWHSFSSYNFEKKAKETHGVYT